MHLPKIPHYTLWPDSLFNNIEQKLKSLQKNTHNPIQLDINDTTDSITTIITDTLSIYSQSLKTNPHKTLNKHDRNIKSIKNTRSKILSIKAKLQKSIINNSTPTFHNWNQTLSSSFIKHTNSSNPKFQH